MSDLSTSEIVSVDEWQQVFERDPTSTAFQSPKWLVSITATGHFLNASRVYRSKRGRVVVPLAVKASRLGRPNAYSMPHGLGAGGPVADFLLSQDDIRWICRDLEQLPFGKVAVRPNPAQSTLWTNAGSAWSVTSRVSHVLNLEGDYERVVGENFDNQTRRHVRKAYKSDLQVERGNTPELMEKFYRLYLRWSAVRAERRNLPVAPIVWLAKRREPRWKYDAVAKGMGADLQVYIASAGDVPVAGAICLRLGTASIYWRGTSDPTLWNKYRGNDLLQDAMIRDACAAGCRAYHMGESGGVPSLMQFKERFGAKPIAYAELVHSRRQLGWHQRDG